MPKAGTEPILSFGTRWLVPAMMLFVGFNPVCLGQQPISGVVYSDSGEPLFGTSLSWSSETNDGVSGANTISSKQGYFSFEVSFPGKLSASILGFMPWDSLIQEQPSTPFHIRLRAQVIALETAEISSQSMNRLEWMSSLSEGGLYRGIKSTIIRPEKTLIVPGEAEARNIFAGLPGANVWESDAAGLQLGVGVRGLSPNRSSHLSMRQNGIPIAADPLGYPEAYYTPPLEAVSTIEHVSGAAALQYGSQLGGMLNFNMKSGDWNAPGKLEALISGAAYPSNLPDIRGHMHLSVQQHGGSEKASHYVLIDHKQGQGWRKNAAFESTTLLGTWRQRWNNEHGAFVLEESITAMRRLEQQPGGLTDTQFENDPQASYRSRNWFRVNWNIGTLGLQWKPSALWDAQLTLHGLNAERISLGFLGTPNRVDPGEDRDLIWGDFRSIGWDIRSTRRWMQSDGQRYHALVLGWQGYLGENTMRQGFGDDTAEPHFQWEDFDQRESSFYVLPNTQSSVFAQGIVSVSDALSFTPGYRWEWIRTEAEGSYREFILDGAGNIIEDSLFTSSQSRNRHVMLPGIGFSWKPSIQKEWYGNAVRNYRAINFSDIQLQDLGVMVDPDIQDEGGFNMDLGCRQQLKRISYDLSVFGLWYQNRIGLLPTTIPDPVLIEKPILLRTNLANARTIGLEAAFQWNIWTSENQQNHLSTQMAGSWMNGIYQAGGEPSIVGNRLEFAPEHMLRIGLTWKSPTWGAQIQWQGISQQFTEATNALRTPQALHGEIPAYGTIDLSIGRSIGGFHIGLKINNASNTMYFTRRALAYPGPGILPSDGRNIRLALSYRPAEKNP